MEDVVPIIAWKVLLYSLKHEAGYAFVNNSTATKLKESSKQTSQDVYACDFHFSGPEEQLRTAMGIVRRWKLQFLIEDVDLSLTFS